MSVAERVIAETIGEPEADSPLDFSWVENVSIDPGLPDWLPNRVFFTHLAGLVYERDYCPRALSMLGFSEYAFIDVDSTQAATAVHESGYAVIIFEGTTDRVDWWRNIQFCRNWRVLGGRQVGTHVGFDKAGKAVDEPLKRILDDWYRRDLFVVVTGHSQGAALALRLGLENPDKVNAVYQLAPPRYMNSALQKLLDAMPFYVVSIGSFFDGVTWTPFWPLYRHHRGLILLDSTRSRVVEVKGLRESWAVIIRWWYLLFYTLYIGGMLLLSMWWELPSWWRRIRRLWSDHAAAKHYAAQMRKLLTASQNARGELTDDRNRHTPRASKQSRQTGIGH